MFFTDLFEATLDLCDKRIFIGDFNCTLNPEIDRRGEKINNEQARRAISCACEEMLLMDVWHSRNPGVARFSFHRTKPKKAASRIDYALVLQGIDSCIASCFYIPNALSDHSAFFISILFEPDQRGAGFWKFNDSFLNDVDFVNAVNDLLQTKINEYVKLNPIDKWEMIKFECANFSQNWGREKAQEKRFILAQLYEKADEIEAKVGTEGNQLSGPLLEILARTKEDIQNLEYEKTRGILFRCKARWQVETERNSKYFYALEKTKYNSKTCTSIFDGAKLIRDPKSILRVQKKFYQDLYTSEGSRFDASGITGPKITPMDQQEMDRDITWDEYRAALKNMPNGKTPGLDGLTVRFYKMFLCKFQNVLFECLDAGMNRHLLHDSARRGVLNVIPKANKDTRRLKNLRPITLLNVDYKIIEKCLASRLSAIMEQIIHFHQKGFLKGRRISANIRKVIDILQHYEQEGDEGILISVDFQKCFDKIEFNTVYGSLRFFGIGENFIQMVKTTYTDFRVCVQNNGNFSDYMAVTRGV